MKNKCKNIAKLINNFTMAGNLIDGVIFTRNNDQTIKRQTSLPK